jgi:5-formyltetrahydrofolate cyclo-ligase
LENVYTGLNKKELRNKFLNIRRNLEISYSSLKSDEILATIKKLPCYQKANTVMFYLSFDGEVITDNMIEQSFQDGKNVAVAAIKNNDKTEMGAFKISNINQATDNVMGIRQPKINNSLELDKQNIDLVFIPGIVFDVNCYRIGYGKGFYDKWLTEISRDKTIGLCYDFQIINRVPVEEFDIRLGMIISEERVVQ